MTDKMTDPVFRFTFGKNWQHFLQTLTNTRIEEAEKSLLKSLGKNTLQDLRFLDVGSGSGLFSLAARRLGATVHSFDYDEKSVECARYLKEKYFPNDKQWVVEQGSVLDKAYLAKLGAFDIVYSWGVLHHTGHMYQAFENIEPLIKSGGQLFISIYNDQGRRSKGWKKIKQFYNASPSFIQRTMIGVFGLWLWKYNLIWGTIRYGNPFKYIIEYKKNRGMSAYYDLVDWVGGYPFEVAKPEEIFQHFSRRGDGLQLINLKTCAGGLGCNEFIFKKAL